MSDRFNELAAIMDRLLGPNGCPWDQEQTLMSLRKYLIEEAYEVIDAINEEKGEELCEELGDLFLNCVFLAKLAEKQGFFPWEAPLQKINEKLIRRHPHIFEKENNQISSDEVLRQWDKIKESEKKTTSLVPKEMPALARAEKLVSLEKKERSSKALPEFDNEEELGHVLLDIVASAKKKGFHAESALRHACQNLEKGLSK